LSELKADELDRLPISQIWSPKTQFAKGQGRHEVQKTSGAKEFQNIFLGITSIAGKGGTVSRDLNGSVKIYESHESYEIIYLGILPPVRIEIWSVMEEISSPKNSLREL